MPGRVSDLTAAVLKARAAQQASVAASKAVAAQIAASKGLPPASAPAVPASV